MKHPVKNSEPLAIISLLPILPLLIYKVLFTLLSFGMFLLDLRVGERLAFGTYACWELVTEQLSTALFCSSQERFSHSCAFFLLYTGVSLLLVIIAQGILTAGLLPICGERLWIDQLTSTSMFWVLGALAESILVAHFFFHGNEGL